MAKNHLDSTILHEHRRVAKLRYILTLIAFVSVLFATLTTRYFVTVRGASDGVVLSITLLCVIVFGALVYIYYHPERKKGKYEA